MGFKSNGGEAGIGETQISWGKSGGWGWGQGSGGGGGGAQVGLKSGRLGLVKSGMREAYVRQGWGLEQEGVGLGLTLGGMRPLHLFCPP